MRTLLWVMLAGCGASDDEPTPDPSEPAAQDDLWMSARRMVGELRFTYSDVGPESPDACSYTRSYEGIDFRDYRDLFVDCQTCGGLFAGTSTLDPETAACAGAWLDQAGLLVQDRTEFWGWSDGVYVRIFSPADTIGTYALDNPSDGEEVSVEWTVQAARHVGALAVSATFTWSLDDAVQVPNPDTVLEGEYACEWPRNNPGDVREPAAIAVGETIPGGLMEDQCGDPLDLRDLYGQPTLFLTATTDCDTCVFQALAAAELVASGADLAVVTLFEGSDEGYEAAKTTYGALGPVLYSRGYVGLMSPFLVGWRRYPEAVWWLVDAEQVVLTAGVGTLDFSELMEVL